MFPFFRSSRLQQTTRRGKTSKHKPGSRRSLARIESLEDRRLLALTISPTAIETTLGATQVLPSLTASGESNAPSTFVDAGLNGPEGMAFDTSGNLYIANSMGDSVSKVTPAGVVSTFASGLEGANGLAFDSSGNLFVANWRADTISKITPSGSVSTFLSTGLSSPEALAFDSSGNIYVANTDGNDVLEITPGGTVSTFVSNLNLPDALAFGASGDLYVGNEGDNTVSKVTPAGNASTFATGFDWPAALAFDTSGNLFVANYNGDSVSKVDSSGHSTTFASTGLNGPTGLAFDRAGNLDVSNFGDETVSQITPAGAVSMLIAPGLDSPTGMAFDASGNLYVANSNSGTVSQITPMGVVSTFADTGSDPQGLAFDQAGNLYVANAGDNTIDEISPGGVVSTFVAASAGLDYPDGLAFDTNGNLYVANGASNTISEVTPTGTVSTFASRLSEPAGLAFGPSGNLYVANYGNNTVSEITPGGVVSRFVSYGLNSPAGLGFDKNGNLYVANYGNSTVSEVTPGGAVSTFIPSSPNISPYGIAFDHLGSLYFSNNDNNTATKAPIVTFSTSAADAANLAAAGLTLNPNGSFSGHATNYPSPNPLTFTVDVNGTASPTDNGSGAITLKVNTPPTFTTPVQLPSVVAGQPTAIQLEATGGTGTVSFTAYSLPPGLMFDGTTGLISGTPTLAGTYSFTASAADSLYARTYQTYSLTVELGISPTNLATVVNSSQPLPPLVLSGEPQTQTSAFLANSLNNPMGMVSDASGNLYIANYGNSTISKVTPAGVVSTFVSLGLDNPAGMTFDSSGNLYVANEGGYTVSKVTPAGVVSVVATFPYSPSAVAFDSSGNVYVGIYGFVDKVSPNGGITTFATIPSGSGLSYIVAGLAFDASGNLYIGTGGNNPAIEKVTPSGVMSFLEFGAGGPIVFGPNGNLYASTSISGYYSSVNEVSEVALDGTTAVIANGLSGQLAFDSSGNLYVAQSNDTIKKITPARVITPFVDAAGINYPTAITRDNNGNFYLFSQDNQTLLKATPTGTVTTLAINPFDNPVAEAFDSSGNLYVANSANGTITKITASGAASTIVSVGLDKPSALAFDASGNLYVANEGDNTVSKVTPSGDVSTFASGFNQPAALAFDSSGNLYVANLGDGSVSQVTPAGLVSSFVSGFTSPAALAFDSSGNLYVADLYPGTVSEVTAGVVNPNPFASGLNGPAALAFDSSGNLYVANQFDSTISQFAPDGTPTTFVSTGLNSPSGLAFDKTGNLFVTEPRDNTVSKVTSVGAVSTFAFNPFQDPSAMAVDGSGNVYVADYSADTVTKATPDGVVSTFVDAMAGLDGPEGIAVGPNGDLYVSNYYGDTVSVVTPAGALATFVSSGLNGPEGLAFDGGGNLYVANNGDSTIAEVAPDGTVSTFVSGLNNPTALGFDSDGNLYVLDSSYYGSSVVKVTPSGTQSTFVTDLANPQDIAVDGSGNVYLSRPYNNDVIKIAPASAPLTVSTADAAKLAAIGLTLNPDGTFSGHATSVPATNPLIFTVNVTDNASPPNHTSTPVTLSVVATAIPLVVTTIDDESDGGTPTNPLGVDGKLSLREAIELAETFGGNQAITFALGTGNHTIALNSALPALSGVAGLNLTIQGPGEGQLTVSGNNAVQVFDVSSDANVTIEDLTIANGSATNGGGIEDDSGTLTLNNVAFNDNTATALGGGLYSSGGTLTITGSLFHDNIAPGGGGMDLQAGQAAVTDSTFSGNTASGSGAYSNGGGGIRTAATLTLMGDTFSGNTSAAWGGGLVTNSYSSVTAINSTFAGNSAADGGGIGVYVSAAKLINSTVSGNTASAAGGGVATDVGNLSLNNALIAGNTSSAGPDVDNTYYSTITANYSLIGDGTGSGITATSTNHNQVGTSTSPIDPLLGPLADNGGPTQTMALLAGSPAIDDGSNALAVDAQANMLTTDQRGTGYPRIVGGTVDIGAFEYQQSQKATPTINWPAPSAITYGTALGAAQLDATASVIVNGVAVPVDGTFAYSPIAGTVLAAGSHTLNVTFTPTDTVDYTAGTGSTTLVVNQATPTINWTTPAAITYGTALSATQLDATASWTVGGTTRSVAGTFAYTPTAGAVVTAGSHTLNVTFTPTDTVDYKTAAGSTTLVVNQATPTINWPTPAAITYGTALSASQLDATSSWTVGGTTGSVAGTFAYTPTAGAVVTAGSHTLNVTFTPTDTTDYKTAAGSTTLVVNQATPTINWSTPAAITYGTALSATQLDATSSWTVDGTAGTVAGTFAYTPAAGAILTAGNHTLNVTFTPTDTTDYKTAAGSTTLVVNQATPTINWSIPTAITYGTALSATQLDASSSWTVGGTAGSVAGSFTYTPAAGTVLTAGSHTLDVNFTPIDTTDYTAAAGSTTLVVNQAAPTTSVNPVNLVYGTALSNSQLTGTASWTVGGVSQPVPGTFAYTTAAGTVLNVGNGQSEAVTFTPTDGTNYTAASGQVTVNVASALTAETLTPPVATEGAPINSVTVFHFSDANVGATIADFTATVNTGDATLTSLANPNNVALVANSGGGFDVEFSYTYVEELSGKTFSVSVTDKGGGTASQSVSNFSVADPAVAAAGGITVNAEAGIATGPTAVATFTDPGGPEAVSHYSAEIDWGDSTSSAGTIAYDTATHVFTVLGDHTYAALGSDAIKVTISHEAAADASATSSATVGEPTTLTATAVPVTGHEFSALAATPVATFTYANGAISPSAFSATIDWGDGSTSAGSVTLSGTTYSVLGSHTYSDERTWPLSVVIAKGTISTTVTTSATIKEALLPDETDGTADERFVSELYRDFFGRAVDADGLSYWTGLLAAGETNEQIALGIEHTTEYDQDTVERLYERYMNRAADSTGLSYFTQLMVGGATVEQVSEMLVSSDEFYTDAGGTDASFVSALYESALGRPAEPAGVTFWTNAMAAGVARAQVIDAILQSDEYHLELANLGYAQLLDRASEPDGASFWADALRAGLTDQQFFAELAGSAEYYAKTSG